jgi:DNA-binding CsgD family transcriptional regulator
MAASRVGDSKKNSLAKGAVEKFAVPQALPVSVAILDPEGTIVGVNEAWEDFGRHNGLRIPNFGVGKSYLQYCQSERPNSSLLVKDLKDLLAGKLDLLTRIYPCDSPTEKRWFYLIGLPLSLQGRSGAALLHVSLTPFLRPQMLASAARPSKASHGGIERKINLDLVAESVENSSVEALSSQLTAMLTAAHRVPSSTSPRDDAERIETCLSKRQLEVLRLLGEGKTNDEIAKALCRSPNTIKLHVSKILHQLNVKSRTQAALLASKVANNDLRSNGDCDVVRQKYLHKKASSRPGRRNSEKEPQHSHEDASQGLRSKKD